jgi:hypothetical protein
MAKTDCIVRDRIAGTPVEIRFDAAHQTARVLEERGDELAGVIAYWFARYGFHPDTSVVRAP